MERITPRDGVEAGYVIGRLIQAVAAVAILFLGLGALGFGAFGHGWIGRARVTARERLKSGYERLVRLKTLPREMAERGFHGFEPRDVRPPAVYAVSESSVAAGTEQNRRVPVSQAVATAPIPDR